MNRRIFQLEQEKRELMIINEQTRVAAEQRNAGAQQHNQQLTIHLQETERVKQEMEHRLKLSQDSQEAFKRDQEGRVQEFVKLQSQNADAETKLSQAVAYIQEMEQRMADAQAEQASKPSEPREHLRRGWGALAPRR